MILNNVITQASANLTAVKTVDLAYADVGNTLNYTIVIVNSGVADAINIIVTDLIPQGANFIKNSIVLDSVPQTGVDPALGINIGNIPSAGSSTITMKASIVNSPYTGNLPNYAQLDYQYLDTSTGTIVNALINSNIAVTTVEVPGLTLTKSSDATSLTGNGQVITYTLKLQNDGGGTSNNTTFIDTIPTGMSFVSNSLIVGGQQELLATIEPPNGFNIGSLAGGYYITLSFQVTVNSVPANSKISNVANTTYSYIVNPNNGVISKGGVLSNTLILTGMVADLSGITKSVDKAYATKGSILTYVITVPNSGNSTAVNVVITDTIPNGTSYINNSLIVSGVSVSGTPFNINIGTIAAGASVTLQFQTVVN